MPTIDFLLIGAQKAGTTSLFEYMRRHPEVHMPPEKEVSFFDRKFDRGASWYLATVLRKAPADATCGEASVGYLGGSPFGHTAASLDGEDAGVCGHDGPREQIIPRRIRALLPEVKLICVLRDPVARAYSHHLMATLNNAESRSFDEAITLLNTPSELERSRAQLSDTNSYIVYGEYARLLSGFTQVFPRAQLLVLFSDDLASDTTATLASVFGFIGVAADVVPDNVETRYRTAAGAPRIRRLDLHAWQAAAARSGLARQLWHTTPGPLRGQVDRLYKLASFRTAVWNARRNVSHQREPSSATRSLLMDHYRREGRQLAQLLGREPPWLAAWDDRAAGATSAPARRS